MTDAPLPDWWSFWRGGKLSKQALQKALDSGYELGLFDAKWFFETIESPGGKLKGTDVVSEGLTKAELTEWIRRDLSTIYHPAGTCAMGGDSGPAASRLTSVVDPELRVRGVDRLRVVDASVMPTVPRGNTNAPVIAIAERAADLISGRAPLAAVDPADLALAASLT